MLFVILSSSLINGCAIAPPDVPLCAEISPSKGYCIFTMSNREYVIDDENTLDGKTWWDLRPTMIYMPSDSWAEVKSFIIKICKKTKQCNGKNIVDWERTVEKIDQNVIAPKKESPNKFIEVR
jgi:hypothetical protein